MIEKKTNRIRPLYLLKANLRDFSAAHRMLNLPGSKCNNLHGHNFSVTVTFAADELNDKNILVDASDAHKYFGSWLQENLDHSVIVSEQDHSLISFLKNENQRCHILTSQKNTSIECIAEYLFKKFTGIMAHHNHIFDQNVHLLEVEMWESKNIGAIYGVNRKIIHGIPCHINGAS
jgi:6-pyruvoyl-tetrahydropterin synthase